ATIDTLPQTESHNLGDISLPKTFQKENSELFTWPQIDWMLKARQKNGLAESGAVLKISNKLYIHKPKFIDWFLSQKAA
ncbi:MAG: hypothetical protein QM504_15335, partial [Pseudomonadota bacterium]